MNTTQLAPNLSVSPQITLDDVKAIKDAGFRTIICNRPDGEEADQPTFCDIEQAAKKVGLETHYQPVVSGNLSDSDMRDFQKAIANVAHPVLAYCRTGTRSKLLWVGSTKVDAATESVG